MNKLEITHTELVWPGKYNVDGAIVSTPPVELPFQTIETVNVSRAQREAEREQPLSLFDVYTGDEGITFEDGWTNKLIWGDNLLVMGSLLRNFAGKIDLIYVDPPFATGMNFAMKTQVGDGSWDITKPLSIIEEKAYSDTWGRGKDSWFVMMYDRLRLLRELLSDTGTIYIHLDWYLGHHLRPVLSEIFGDEQSLGEIIWGYGSPSGGRVMGSKLVKAHDIIYIFAKKYGQHTYNQVYLQYSKKYIEDWFRYEDENGLYQKRYRKRKDGTRYIEKQYLKDSRGIPASTVWTDIQQVYADPRAYRRDTTSEITGYPTQKPTALLERIIEISSQPGDLVADFFSGSGTTLIAAENKGRRWIGCELGRWGVHVARKRLLDKQACKPFQLLNLGLYERQHWQGKAFQSGIAETPSSMERSLYEYIAFVLKLYGAVPLSGYRHLHGYRGNTFVRIGAVDAPVTIGEIDLAIDECRASEKVELHVLGWEWEMGLLGLMEPEAKRQGIVLRLFQIPREVMEIGEQEAGGIRFFELAHMECEVENTTAQEVRLRLTDFSIPNATQISPDVRDKITKWSDYIDYWAVDWNFQQDTFSHDFVAYRTPTNPVLPTVSEVFTYDGTGHYSVLVKVVDIFGNDTSKQLTINIE